MHWLPVMLIEAKLLRTRPRMRTKPRGCVRGRGQNHEAEDKAEDNFFLVWEDIHIVSNYTRQSSDACMPHTKNYNLITSANILPTVIQASPMAVNSKFVLRWHGTYCRMQIIGLGFVVKYTYAQGQVTNSEDMPRPDARGRGWGRGQHVEAKVEAEDKISASRTVWPRGLNITAGYLPVVNAGFLQL